MKKKKENFGNLSIDDRIEKLKEKKEKLLYKLEDVEDELDKAYHMKLTSDDVSHVDVSFGDLIWEMEDLVKSGIKELDLCALPSYYKDGNSDDIANSVDNMRFFGSRLFVTFENGTMIWYNNLNLFDNFDEVQKDGSTLLDHCSVRDGSFQKDLVVDKDYYNVTCHINMKELENDTSHCDHDHILQSAIHNCFINGKAKAVKKGYQKRK